MVKKVLSFILLALVLNLSILPALSAHQTFAAESAQEESNDQLAAITDPEPAYAFPIFIAIPLIIAGATVLGQAVGAFLNNDLACLTSINCVVSKATMGFMDNWINILIGTPLSQLTGDKVTSMVDGTWGSGLAFTAAETVDGVYLNPPDIHLASYVNQKLSNTLLSTPKVQAALETTGGGSTNISGDQLLNPVLTIWQGMRDAAYALFLVIMVAIGFMIILRREIAPRVVVSFTYALPRIVVGLALITFSYPLIGFTFDVVGNVGSSVINSTLANVAQPADSAYHKIDTGKAEGGIVGTVLGPNTSKFVGYSVLTVLRPFVDKIQGAPNEVSVGESLKALVIFFVFFTFLVAVMILIAGQLLFRLAKLLLYTIFSPFIILFGTLPGQEGTITDFFKNVIATVAAFPAIAFMFGVTSLILRQALLPTRPEVFSDFFSIGYGSVSLIFLTIVFMMLTFTAPNVIQGFISGEGPKKKK